MDTMWDAPQMPSQRGRIALITGAAQGLGLECALQLVDRGARVLVADFDEPKARAAVQQLRARAASGAGENEAAAQVEFVRVDLGCMASVQRFAETVHTKLDRLDLLINNAGVGVPSERKCTDGYSIQFGINHLGHFYLTTLLFDLLQKSHDARVVNVTSIAHRQDVSWLVGNPREIDWTKIASGEDDTVWMAYEKSKLCNLLFTYELDRRLRAAGVANVKAVAAHPGITRTNIWGFLGYVFMLILQSVAMGCLPILYAATAEDVESGEFFGPRGWRACTGYPAREQSSPESRSEESSRELWKLSEQLTKTAFRIQ